jgi:cell division protein FtsB
MLLLRRLRVILIPLVFHSAAAAASAYFVWHAVNGQRGLKTRNEYEAQIASLQGDLDRLAAERARWSRRIALVQGDTMDRDVLDEQARSILGRVSKYDVVILNPDKKPAR